MQLHVEHEFDIRNFLSRNGFKKFYNLIFTHMEKYAVKSNYNFHFIIK